ncbi:LysR family transcriptional regulator [Streptomyces flavofungini]|uniref:LysR family transcriptional regulator n=1 Tax=Streptomyces flavofungini TaxID=68200 RepID=UPI0025B08A54|nr:LysR family transcriptional regulator [Streptomyces flavofungini]WJV44197.1 LysR family transcriptional regulator [Streptomyces flavofungini]
MNAGSGGAGAVGAGLGAAPEAVRAGRGTPAEAGRGDAADVELRHLRALVAIDAEGTVTDAAIALGVSQPALSRTLRQLESRLSTRLVDRSTRHVALTDAGRRLVEHAHRILRLVDDALAETAADGRPLRIGFAWSALGRYTVPLLRAWRENRPDTAAQVLRRDDPQAALRRGEVDLALLRTEPVPDSDLVCVPLLRERRVAALAVDHTLAGQQAVRLEELSYEPVVICSTAATTAAHLWPTGRRPHTFEVPGVDEWLTTIATGEAVGVTAESAGHSHPHPGVRYVPLTDAPSVTVHLVHPRVPRHPATAEFLDHIRMLLAEATRTESPETTGLPYSQRIPWIPGGGSKSMYWK